MSLGPLTLGNTAGSWAFAFLIPLIIIYLIRPRPVNVEIPSLMFFLESKSNPRQKSFFRRLSKDWLLLLQILLLALLAATVLNPFSTYEYDVTAANTVLVIDVSASSQVKEGGSSRFIQGLDAAEEVLASRNTIILAKNSPKIILEEGDRSQARDALKGLIPLDTPSAIGDAIILAGETLGGQEGRVVVISDFINTIGIAPERARDVLEGKGIIVDFISTATARKKSNVGIINIEIDDETTTVFVKNYNDNLESVTAHIGDFTKKLSIPPKSVETFSIQTPEKLARIEIDVNDDFDVDNIAFTSAPEKSATSVLLITNNESVYLKNVLDSLDNVELTIAEPPIIPKDKFDIFVIGSIYPSQILPGTFEGIKDHVMEGSSVIITANQKTPDAAFAELSPVVFDGLGETEYIQVDQLNTFTKDIEFGTVSSYLKTIPGENSVTIASAGESPIISFKQLGSGKATFFGIIESESEFKVSPSYPIFWSNLIKFMIERESIQNLNLKTGDTILLSRVTKIKTPTQTVKQNAILLEEQGIYELEDRKVAVNLKNDKESAIVPEAVEDAGTAIEVELKPVKEERTFEFEVPMLIGVLVLLLMELLYVKIRGDF